MLTFLRLQLAMLPALFSLWQQSADATADGQNTTVDATGTNGGNADQTVYRTQADFDAAFTARLAREKKALEESIKAELTAEAAKKKLEEDQKHKELADTYKAERDAEKAARAADAEKARDRAIKSAVKLAAIKLNAVDEDAVYALLDRSKVDLDDDGEPTNAEALVTALLKDKPFLVKPEGTNAGGTPPGQRGNGHQPKTRDDIKNQYLKQAGRA